MLSVGLGACLASLAVHIGMFIYSMISRNAVPPLSDIPVLVHFNNQQPLFDYSKTVSLFNISGSLLFMKVSPWIQYYFTFYEMALTISTGVCILLIRKLIRTVIDGDPFIPRNGKRLRALAIIIIAVPLALQISAHYVTKAIISQLNFPGISLSSGLLGKSTLLVCIFSGLLLFVISEVFRIGTSLKEEQELTV